MDVDTLDERADVDAPDTTGERREVVVPFELRADTADDGLTLSGYAAVFNAPTRIFERGGEFTEQIAPGAFRHTIRNGKPVMQFDHGQHPLIGSLPIANITKLREDARGLYVEARVFDNWLTEPLRDAIAAQAIDGMSFRFEVVKDTWTRAEDGGRTRTLNEVKLHELGPVVFPAYADTSVALRSLARVAPDLFPASPEPPAAAVATDPAVDDPAAGQSPNLTHLRARALRVRAALLKETP